MKRSALIFLCVVGVLFSCKEKIPNGPKRGETMQAILTTKDGKTDYVQWNHYDDRYELQNIDQASFDELMRWQVPFKVQLANIFDEVLDGTKEIRIQIRLWQPGRDWVRHLSYTEVDLSDSVQLHPGKTRDFFTGDSLVWDQRDDSGALIFPVGHYKWYLVQEVVYDTLVPDTVDGKPGYVMKRWGDCDTLAVFDKDSVVAFKKTVTILATARVQLFHEYNPVQSDTLKLHIRYLFPSSYLKRKIGCYPGFREGEG